MLFSWLFIAPSYSLQLFTKKKPWNQRNNKKLVKLLATGFLYHTYKETMFFCYNKHKNWYVSIYCIKSFYPLTSTKSRHAIVSSFLSSRPFHHILRLKFMLNPVCGAKTTSLSTCQRHTLIAKLSTIVSDEPI